MSKTDKCKWLDDAVEHDYPAAQAYFSLVYPESKAAARVMQLKAAPITEFESKDFFRAASLALPGGGNSHAQKHQQRIQSGLELSPLLLVRDSANGKLLIADGHHHLCAVYAIDEDAASPVK